MARLPRFRICDVPIHVVQRGNNRTACFLDDADRLRYLDELGSAAQANSVDIHAYVLMSNHVHLMLTVRESGSLSRAMQALGRRYVCWFNARHGRTGTLWEGRFHESPIGSDRYLWNCHRYIELNPVRAGICAHPAEFRWSSHAGNAHGRDDPILTPAPQYQLLGPDRPSRCDAYRALFLAPTDDDVEEIRGHLRQQRPMGDPSFQARLAAHAGRVPATAKGRERVLPT
jgi:putative transposase